MIIKRVPEGCLIPRFYGVAWHSWQTSQAVCLPLGLNAVAALARNAYYTVKHAGRIVRSNPREAYEQGLRDGRASVSAPRAGVEPTRPWSR